MRRQGYWLVVSAFLFTSSLLQATELKITTFNVKNYGGGGLLYGDHEEAWSDKIAADEHRDKTIREFMKREQIFSSDVIAFQEVLDVDRLQKKILDKVFACTSYKLETKEQHVVICLKGDYEFVKAPDDNNFILEDIALGNLRPAVHGIIKDKKTGDELIHIFAVHLKAFPEAFDTRLNQIGILAKYLKEKQDQTPSVILGDFNSYDNEPEKFDDIFNQQGLPIVEIETQVSYTYRTTKYKSKFDRFWIDHAALSSDPPEVSGPCNNASNSEGEGYQNISYYNKNVSDHCPVTIHVRVD